MLNSTSQNETILSQKLIYDETYQNAKRKSELENNPKYSYFNTIMKIKNKQNMNKGVYNNLFKNKTEESLAREKEHLHEIEEEHINPLMKVINVEKINRKMYKIYRKKNPNFLKELPKIKDLNFKVYQGAKIKSQKRYFEMTDQNVKLKQESVRKVDIVQRNAEVKLQQIKGIKKKRKSFDGSRSLF